MLSLVPLDVGIGRGAAVGRIRRDKNLALRLFLTLEGGGWHAARVLKTSVCVCAAGGAVVDLLLYLLILLYCLGCEYHVDLVQVCLRRHIVVHCHLVGYGCRVLLLLLLSLHGLGVASLISHIQISVLNNFI